MSCFIGGLMTELHQDLYLLRFVSIEEASTPTLKLLKAMVIQDFIKNCSVVIFLDSGSSRNFIDLALFKWLGSRIMIVSTLFLLFRWGIAFLILTLATFWAYVTKVVDLKLIMGILEKKKISARFMAKSLSHSKGLGAIDVLVSFPIIGEFYVGGLPIQQQ